MRSYVTWCWYLWSISYWMVPNNFQSVFLRFTTLLLKKIWAIGEASYNVCDLERFHWISNLDSEFCQLTRVWVMTTEIRFNLEEDQWDHLYVKNLYYQETHGMSCSVIKLSSPLVCTEFVKNMLTSSICHVIGEREQANLVVQQARFLMLAVCCVVFRFYAATHYHKSFQYHVHRDSRMRKYIPRERTTLWKLLKKYSNQLYVYEQPLELWTVERGI